ncbi:glycoside hydrolase family 92 [Pyrenophora seminiperda CCB06]|uniref:Glycoside hydrolase family 92 n=1 Tax=Pyrenophora seminiperda CCB06 TaxID=1302712 RepID=A0A3M7MII6_9PLEO|nr:glycoside hydrolase family 92 [Pyrenophora seminiperda CCB06]
MPPPRSTSKRPAPETRARQSKRARATARKSYVEPETDTDDDEDGPKKHVHADEAEDSGAASEYEKHVDKDPSSESEQDETASDEDSETEKVKRKGPTAKKLPIHKKNADEKELWKPGAKLEPGTQLIIKKPKARDAGDTPYLDHTIHPNTMLFLKDLAANNDRQWLKLHDPDFRASFQDFTTFTEKVSEKIIEADGTIPELPVKDVVRNGDYNTTTMFANTYRSIVYTEVRKGLCVWPCIMLTIQDIRFSKDPTPYKRHAHRRDARSGHAQLAPHLTQSTFCGRTSETCTKISQTYFSAAWSRTGRKGPYAHYYIQVQPNGGSFVAESMLTAVGGGFWQPDAPALAKLRRDIDRKPHKIKAVLRNAGIRKHFLGGAADDDKKAVKAFTSLPMNQSNALKRNPKFGVMEISSTPAGTPFGHAASPTIKLVALLDMAHCSHLLTSVQGYEHDHKDIELLRLRNFTVGRKLEDDKVMGTGGLDRVAELVLCLEPFITYLNSVVMPDEDTSGSGSSDDEDGSDAESDNGSGGDAEEA